MLMRKRNTFEPHLSTKQGSFMGQLNGFGISKYRLHKNETKVSGVARHLMGVEISVLRELDLFTLRKAGQV
jgi:hypothetical protein